MQVNLEDLLNLAQAIRTVQPEVHTFEFSRYVYRPQTIADERNVFFLPAPRLAEGFQEAFSALRPEEEIAINSRVYLRNGEMRHIPMLDLIGDFNPVNVPLVRACLADYSIPRFRLYSSGRSFHLYGVGCLAPERYEKFLGRALLMNLPGKADIVDQRWIGHRILGGFATLRWTNRSGYYLACPKFAGEYE
jgi:hypothetical protein